MERSLLTGIAAFRWAAWAWMATVALVSRHEMARPWLAIVLGGLALAVTAGATAALRLRPGLLLGGGAVGAELVVGAGLVLGDGFAYGPGHAFSPSQSLGVAWPLAGVLAAGAAFGPWAGAGSGLVLGAAKVGAVAANGVRHLSGQAVVSLCSTTFLYGLAGGVAGHVTALLQRAEREISAARAREEVSRTLHDGVLQTLAVIERRAEDPSLARLAYEQERDLRAYLFGSPSRHGADGRGEAGTQAGARLRGPRADLGRALRGPAGGDLGRALRAAAARFEDAFEGRVDVTVAEDVRPLPPRWVEALSGAVGEALVNAGKHGQARRVTVFVEPAGGGIFCSVKDDGTGFDTGATTEGVGLRRSIRARIAEAGGRAEVESRPGAGTEVRMWL